MRAAERRAVAAERIAEEAQANVGRALGAFHKMADFGLAVVDRDQGKLSMLETTKKLLIANRERVEKYGVQVVREGADSQNLDVVRYSLMEGTESSIKAERGACLMEEVGGSVPTTDPEKLRSAFVEGGKAFLSCSPGRREVRVNGKSKRRRVF
jgi:hypothetical protein